VDPHVSNQVHVLNKETVFSLTDSSFNKITGYGPSSRFVKINEMADPLAHEGIRDNVRPVIFDGTNFVNWNVSVWFPIQRNELEEKVLETKIRDEVNFYSLYHTEAVMFNKKMCFYQL
jgi:hypothetical protein